MKKFLAKKLRTMAQRLDPPRVGYMNINVVPDVRGVNETISRMLRQNPML